jgi:regulator of replication initiation timing
MKDSFDLHSWYLKQYSLYETDDPKIGAEEEGDPNEFVVGEVDSLKYSISEYITENKNVNIEEIKNYLNELKTLSEEKSKLCKRGQAYVRSRKAAGEKSSAYLSGRGVKVCKGQIKYKGKKVKSWSESLNEEKHSTIDSINIVYTEDGGHYDTKVIYKDGKVDKVPGDMDREELSDMLKKIGVNTNPSVFIMDYNPDSSEGFGMKELERLNSALKQAKIKLDIDFKDL